MRVLFILIGFLWSSQLMAQDNNPAPQEPPYKRFPNVPPYELLGTDSTRYTKADLGKKPVLLMYFSPTCDHCIQQMADMNKYWKQLETYQIVLATYEPMEDLAQFIKRFGLDQHSNIIAGRDEKFMLPGFFAMRSLPYLALYDKKGALITTFEGTTKMEKVLEGFGKK